MKKNIIIELCKNKIIEDFKLEKNLNNAKEGFGCKNCLDVMGFKEYDEYCILLILIKEFKDKIYIESVYDKPSGEIFNTILVRYLGTFNAKISGIDIGDELMKIVGDNQCL